MLTVRIAKRQFDLDAELVRRAVVGVLPEPITDHYVVVDGRRFPPKQVLALMTGVDRADLTTHHARRTLRRLGFTTGRKSDDAWSPLDQDQAEWPHGGREAAALRPYRGRWVAQRELEVLVSADAPEQVMAWLARHNVEGAVVFRVPAQSDDVQGATSLGLG
ncbi:MAG: hypothetical protein ACRDZO_06060 [Egibacteraceae bacterium]